jgi:alkyl hydroperoxide reductase subunit D
MSLEALKDSLPDFAKDTRLNIGTVITSAQGITLSQALAAALACAYTTKNDEITSNILSEVTGKISDAEINAAKSASVIMGMNNVYYRATHLAEDEELMKMPAGLRMQVIGNPGVEKIDFELYCLAVSAINGCGACVASHVKQAAHAGVTKQGIQSALKISAVINAAAQAVYIKNFDLNNQSALAAA